MFLLLRYGFKKLINRKKERNICILGLDGAGKSSLLNDVRYQFNEPGVIDAKELVPTIGLNFSKIELENYTCTLWDVGGQKRLREIWQSYLQDIDLLVWIVDSAEESRFRESCEEFWKLMKDPLLVYVPVAVLANKQDKSGAVKAEKIRKELKLDELNDRKREVFLTSFAGPPEEDYGLDKLLPWMVETFHSDPTSQQRTEWRKSQKEIDV